MRRITLPIIELSSALENQRYENKKGDMVSMKKNTEYFFHSKSINFSCLIELDSEEVIIFKEINGKSPENGDYFYAFDTAYKSNYYDACEYLSIEHRFCPSSGGFRYGDLHILDNSVIHISKNISIDKRVRNIIDKISSSSVKEFYVDSGRFCFYKNNVLVIMEESEQMEKFDIIDEGPLDIITKININEIFDIEQFIIEDHIQINVYTKIGLISLYTSYTSPRELLADHSILNIYSMIKQDLLMNRMNKF